MHELQLGCVRVLSSPKWIDHGPVGHGRHYGFRSLGVGDT